MPILTWLRRLFRRQHNRLYADRVDFGFGLAEFRAEQTNITSMDRLLRSPLGHKILSVLHFHRPYGYPIRGKASLEDAAMEHMRREGHEGAIALLLAMGRELKAQEEPTITWGVEDEEDTEAGQ